ncbi:MAG: hypothetical protein LUH63_10430 [Parabacteroides sp.]|nr:hypothetical protein [Parabacteroides sp.]
MHDFSFFSPEGEVAQEARPALVNAVTPAAWGRVVGSSNLLTPTLIYKGL